MRRHTQHEVHELTFRKQVHRQFNQKVVCRTHCRHLQRANCWIMNGLITIYSKRKASQLAKRRWTPSPSLIRLRLCVLCRVNCCIISTNRTSSPSGSLLRYQFEIDYVGRLRQRGASWIRGALKQSQRSLCHRKGLGSISHRGCCISNCYLAKMQIRFLRGGAVVRTHRTWQIEQTASAIH